MQALGALVRAVGRFMNVCKELHMSPRDSSMRQALSESVKIIVRSVRKLVNPNGVEKVGAKEKPSVVDPYVFKKQR